MGGYLVLKNTWKFPFIYFHSSYVNRNKKWQNDKNIACIVSFKLIKKSMQNLGMLTKDITFSIAKFSSMQVKSWMARSQDSYSSTHLYHRYDHPVVQNRYLKIAFHGLCATWEDFYIYLRYATSRSRNWSSWRIYLQ